MVGIDLDGGGRVDRIATFEPGRVTRVVRAPAPGSRPARTVVMAIDAVPYAVFARLQREGLFREFFPAARMLAPFPSLTNVGYATILKTAPVLGYEDKYYDPVRNRVAGGIGDRLGNRYKKVAPFHEVFDWEPPHLWGVTVYYFPMTVSRAELRRIEQILHSSEDEELVLYFGGTDALGHVRGWKGLEECLRLVDQVVKGFLAAGGAERRVVLFSDHGTTAVPSRRTDLAKALRTGGLSPRRRGSNAPATWSPRPTASSAPSRSTRGAARRQPWLAPRPPPPASTSRPGARGTVSARSPATADPNLSSAPTNGIPTCEPGWRKASGPTSPTRRA